MTNEQSDDASKDDKNETEVELPGVGWASDELDETAVDASDTEMTWEDFEDLPPEAIIDYYGHISEVPDEYKKEAQQRILSESVSGKRAFLSTGETIPFEITDDLRRGYTLAMLDGFAARIRDVSNTIVGSVESDERFPIEIPPNDVGIGFYQIHALTISYIEAAARELLSYKMETGRSCNPRALIQWANHKDRAGDSIDLNNPWDDKVTATMNWVLDGGVYRLILALQQSEITDNTFSTIAGRVRSRRNNCIHTPHTVATAHAKTEQEVHDAVEDCLAVVNTLSELLDELPRHRAYHSLKR